MDEIEIAPSRTARMSVPSAASVFTGLLLLQLHEIRDEVGEFAPKLLRTSIPQESIGSLIGPGGKTIRRLEEETGASIDIQEDGSVKIPESAVR
ncbi:MAG: polyribonucleotide nucleotidyltransferase, partial [Proteobacteria bacterium]|nr:polyribonucleotide nucleotidyltransferase [Pseudomonadota bacterium]